MSTVINKMQSKRPYDGSRNNLRRRDIDIDIFTLSEIMGKLEITFCTDKFVQVLTDLVNILEILRHRAVEKQWFEWMPKFFEQVVSRLSDSHHLRYSSITTTTSSSSSSITTSGEDDDHGSLFLKHICWWACKVISTIPANSSAYFSFVDTLIPKFVELCDRSDACKVTLIFAFSSAVLSPPLIERLWLMRLLDNHNYSTNVVQSRVLWINIVLYRLLNYGITDSTKGKSQDSTMIRQCNSELDHSKNDSRCCDAFFRYEFGDNIQDNMFKLLLAKSSDILTALYQDLVDDIQRLQRATSGPGRSRNNSNCFSSSSSSSEVSLRATSFSSVSDTTTIVNETEKRPVFGLVRDKWRQTKVRIRRCIPIA